MPDAEPVRLNSPMIEFCNQSLRTLWFPHRYFHKNPLIHFVKNMLYYFSTLNIYTFKKTEFCLRTLKRVTR
jgi:hypothetical protein